MKLNIYLFGFDLNSFFLLNSTIVTIYMQLRFISDFRFKEEHVSFVRTLLHGADEEFFVWLSSLSCDEVVVKAIKEGQTVFPRVPLLRIEVCRD